MSAEAAEDRIRFLRQRAKEIILTNREEGLGLLDPANQLVRTLQPTYNGERINQPPAAKRKPVALPESF